MDDAIDGLTSINRWSVDFNTTTNNVAGNIAAAILGVLLLFVVWALASNKENARTYLITWLVLVIFTILFILK